MAGVLDPIGPEPPRTYWWRRAVVLAAVVVLIVLVVVGVTAIVGSVRDDRGAAPVVGSTASPVAPEGPDSSEAAGPSPSGRDGSPSARPTSSSTAAPRPSSTTSRTEAPRTSPTPTAPAAPQRCDADDLRATLTGPRTVSVGRDVRFTAGVINGGTRACRFVLDPDGYEFRIYSGTDRIWSTDDCRRWLPAVDVVLGPEKATEWAITWDVTRSKQCGATRDVLRPGTYVANSVLDDVDPVQLVMTLN